VNNADLPMTLHDINMFDKLPSNESTLHASMDSIKGMGQKAQVKAMKRKQSVNPN